METPPTNRCATEAPAAAMIPGGPRCGTSTYAFRFFGSGCTGYAGVGTDLAAPLPPDGGDPTSAICADGGVPPVAHKTPYDLSAYKAISFWGRTGEQSVPKGQQVQFKLPMLVDTRSPTAAIATPWRSAASAAPATASSCRSRRPGSSTPSIWTRPTRPTGSAQETWGKAFTWDPTNVTSIQFQAKGSATFDIWIDDIRLIPK